MYKIVICECTLKSQEYVSHIYDVEDTLNEFQVYEYALSLVRNLKRYQLYIVRKNKDKVDEVVFRCSKHGRNTFFAKDFYNNFHKYESEALIKALAKLAEGYNAVKGE